MKRRKLLTIASSISLILVLVCFLFMTACAKPAPTPTPTPSPTPTPAPAPKTLRIGLVLGLTGMFSPQEMTEVRETKILQDMINEKGGITINGEKYLIELVIEDNKGTFDGAVTATNKLVYDEKIKFLLGFSPILAPPVKDITESNKILRGLSYCVGEPGALGPDTPYTFLCKDSMIGDVTPTLSFFKEHYPEVKKFVVVETDDASVIYVLPKVQALAKSLGLSQVGDVITYPLTTVDFTPIATKAVAAAKQADGVLLIGGIVPWVAQLLRGMRELGYNGPIGGPLCLNPADVMHITGKEAATKFFSTGLVVGIPMPETPPLLAELIKRDTEKYGTEITISGGTANGVYCFAQAIQAAQSLDPTVVRDTWEKMETIETIYGTGWMGGLTTYGIKHAVAHPEGVVGLEDGQVVFYKWMEVRIP